MKRKLAVSTLAFQDWSLEDAVKVCKENEIEAMEIRMNFHPWSDTALSDETYREMYEYLCKNQMKVSDLGTSIRINRYDEQAFEELRRCSQIANILHCRGLRIMMGFKKKRWSDDVPEVDYAGTVKWLIEADEILQQYQTEIWIETHDEFAKGEVLRKLLNQHEFKNIRLLWDIMHPLESGEQPQETLDYVKDDLVHVHIKDGLPWDDPDRSSWKYTRIGEGAVPIKEIVDMITASGYDGYFSLEWERAWRTELRGAGFEVDKMIRQYAQFMDY